MNVQKIGFSFVLSKPNVTWFARFEWDRSLLVQLSQPSQAQAKPSLIYSGTINIPGVLSHSARWRTQHYINSGSRGNT